MFLIRDFLDAKTCATLIEELRSSPTTQAPVYIEGSDERIHETVRKTTSLHPSEETICQLRDRLFEQKSALEAHFGLSVSDRSFFVTNREISSFAIRTATRTSLSSIICESAGYR